MRKVENILLFFLFKIISVLIIFLVYYRYISMILDIILLFESYLAGTLKLVFCRLYNSKQVELIKSRNIFIYESCISGIKQWIDGILWNNSCLCGDFLVYYKYKKS
jgi:Gti1/Pac2 family